MMPSPPIDDRSDNCHSRWLAAGNAQACADPPDCPAVAPQILSCNVPPARSSQRAHPCFAENQPRQPLLYNIIKPNPVAKSP